MRSESGFAFSFFFLRGQEQDSRAMWEKGRKFEYSKQCLASVNENENEILNFHKAKEMIESSANFY